MATRLNLGCEFDHKPGSTNIDIDPQCKPDITADAQDLHMFNDNSVDHILASHLLEHFYERQVLPVLREWNRVLRPEGTILIVVPDAQKVCRDWMKGRLSQIDILKGFIGNDQAKSPYMLHKTFFWFSRLEGLLEASNFYHIHELNQKPGLLWLQVSARKRP